MSKFPLAAKKLLEKMVCMKCYATNPIKSNNCRKCNSTQLRPKRKEKKKV